MEIDDGLYRLYIEQVNLRCVVECFEEANAVIVGIQVDERDVKLEHLHALGGAFLIEHSLLNFIFPAEYPNILNSVRLF